MFVSGLACGVKGHRPLASTQVKKTATYRVKRPGHLCFVSPRDPPESTGPAGVISDTRDRPPEFITKLFRFLYKPGSGWTDRFGFAWPVGELDSRTDLERAAAREQAAKDVVNIDNDERRERIQLGLILTADIWDVDGTGMQLVPDVELARKLRKKTIQFEGSQLTASAIFSLIWYLLPL